MRAYAAQKAGLTRALKTGDHEKVIEETRRTMGEWASAEWREKYGTNAWPDDWARWQRALDDTAKWPNYTDILDCEP